MNGENLNITTLQDLLDYDVRELIVSEMQLKNILSEWITTASSLKLKTELQKYQNIVQMHARQMESFIEEEKINSLSTINRIMNAFINATEDKLKKCADTEIRDSCLLASIQTISHFKISAYGTMASFAIALGMDKIASVFQAAKATEKQIDDRLCRLAECEINVKAKVPLHLIK